MYQLKLQGALFQLHDVNYTRPLTWRYGERVLRGLLNLGEGNTLDAVMLKIGKRLKAVYVEEVRKSYGDVNPPLAKETRELKGHNTFLDGQGYDDRPGGPVSFLDSLEPVLLKGNQPVYGGWSRGGYSGVGLIPKKLPSTHSTARAKITNWKLINVLCQQGLVMSKEQLGPEKVKRIMIWRRKNFGREMYRLNDSIATGVERWDESSGSYIPETDDSWAAIYKDAIRAGRHRESTKSTHQEKWWKTHALKQALGDTGKPFLFIPPRPLFTEPATERLAAMTEEIMMYVLNRAVQITVHTLGYEPWRPDSWAKVKAHIATIDV